MGWSNGNPSKQWAGINSGLCKPGLCSLGCMYQPLVWVESLRASVQVWKFSRGQRKPPKKFASFHCPTTIITFVTTAINKNSYLPALKYWNWLRRIVSHHSCTVFWQVFWYFLSVLIRIFIIRKRNPVTPWKFYTTPKKCNQCIDLLRLYQIQSDQLKRTEDKSAISVAISWLNLDRTRLSFYCMKKQVWKFSEQFLSKKMRRQKLGHVWSGIRKKMK